MCSGTSGTVRTTLIVGDRQEPREAGGTGVGVTPRETDRGGGKRRFRETGTRTPDLLSGIGTRGPRTRDLSLDRDGGADVRTGTLRGGETTGTKEVSEGGSHGCS